MMKKVGIVNYRMGNLDSVARAVEECGGHPVVTSSGSDLEKVSYIILPGVGSFAAGMENIRRFDLDKILVEQVVEKGIPFLGICLGMQLLAEKGYEGVETDGLGWFEAEVKRLKPSGAHERIPHVGWNDVIWNQNSPLFRDIPSGKDFYFVHSYHMICRNDGDAIAFTPYCGQFVSAVNKDYIFGVQFHPEKSQKPGFQVIKNFMEL
jgi:glutamine amidotransferase